MSKIKLIKPTLEYEKDIMDYRQEFLQSGDPLAGCGSLRTQNSVKDWLDEIKLLENPETCPDDKVCSNTYLAVNLENNKTVGVIDFRHHIDHPILSLWGGHIGYSVKASERKKGYAKEMLKQVLPKCKKHGLSKVLITCDANNMASEKIILANGGSLEKDILVDGETVRRYWIKL